MDDTSSNVRPSRAMVTVFSLAAFLCCAIIVLAVLARFSPVSLVDDGYMFVRYAHNVLSHGVVAWNPEIGASYGNTSNLFLVVVVFLHAVLPHSPGLSAWLSSAIPGMLFFVLLAILIWHCTAASRSVRAVLILLILISFCCSIEDLATHFTSGMDTMFSLAFLTMYILVCKWHERSLSNLSAAWVGIVGGLAFYARPDLMLYALLVPASMVLFSPGRAAKRKGLVILGLSGLVVASELLISALFLHSALPLPYYAKRLHYYGAEFYHRYRRIPFIQLADYVTSNRILFAVIGLDLLLDFKGWRKRSSAVEKGLLVATCAFIFYYLFFVLQIMHQHQRFYYPTLPALAFLACGSAVRIIHKVLETAERAASEARAALSFVAVFLLPALLCAPALSVANDWIAFSSTSGIRDPMLADFDLLRHYKTTKKVNRVWFGLDEFSALPDDLVIATTEIGLPSVLNPDKMIVDLSGLHETDFAHNGFSADLLFQKYHPDLIYMPVPSYKLMLRQILENAYFRDHYEYFPAETLGDIGLDMALHRDSKYYAAMRRIVEKKKPG